MRSAATAFALLLLLAATPVVAQDRAVEWTLWTSMVDLQGSNDLGGFTIDTDNGIGFGLSANFLVTERFSAEVAYFGLSSDAELSVENITFDMDGVDTYPLTIGLQYHFVPESRWDPYIGGGAAYVSASDIQSEDLDSLGVGAIELNDQLTWFANGGVGYRLGETFGLAMDLRYVAYEPTSISKVTGATEDLALSPLFLSLGLKVRF